MRAVNDDDPEKVPLPIAQSSLDEARASSFAADLADPATPLGAASLWRSALEDTKRNLVALRTLSANPTAWGDYSEIAAILSDMSIMTVVQDCPDDDDIKYVKFVHFAGEVGVAFADAPLNDFWAVTMVRVPGPLTWKVWGLSRNRFPSSAQVRI